MKGNPTLAGVSPLKLSRESAKMALDELFDGLKRDQSDCDEWLDRQRIWRAIRNGTYDKPVGGPTTWASDMNLPLSELYCTQIAPSYMNLLFANDRFVAMDPQDPDSFETAIDAEETANNVMKRMPNLEHEVSSIISNMVTGGVGLAKIYWAHHAETGCEVIMRREMPGVLGMLSIQPKATERDVLEQIQLLQQSHPQNLEILTAVFGAPVAVMNRAMFNKYKKQIGKIVEREYGLDLSVKEDRAALNDIIEWMGNGMPGDSIEVTKRVLIESCPRVVALNPEEVIVPPGTKDFAHVERMAHRMWMTEEDLRRRKASKAYKAEAVDAMLKEGPAKSFVGSGSQDIMTFDRYDHHGMTTRGEGYDVWECYFYIRDRSGFSRKATVTLDGRTGQPLTDILPYPYAHGDWPIVWFPFEGVSQEYHLTRGIPQLLRDVESHVNAWYRHLEDNLAISSNVTFVYRRNAFTNFDDIEFTPGVGIPADNPSDIQQLNMPPVHIPIERVQQFLLIWPERIIGGIDNQLGDNARLLEPRTATEVSQLENARQRVLSLRARLFMASWKKVFRQVWGLFRQYGPNDFYVQGAGQKPRAMTQYQVRGQFDVVPVGSVGNMDPVFRAAEMLQVLQLSMQVAPMFQGDPRFEIDTARAFYLWLKLKDPKTAGQIIKQRPPQVVQQILAQQSENAQLSGSVANIVKRMQANEEVSDDEMAIVLETMRTVAPHKDLQRVVGQAQMDQMQAVRGQTLVGGNGAANGGVP